ncbi:coiled-coil-helix-coiled-coil-helix domain-containing protein 2-like isoform X2 [Varroa jacobsoni]|uniref:coiled-coil-helix-coiled-coil-helix domain-containing protein 2-like isoform X2 n=1 Tax=Varroa jacobsoni TaxID=62625 RepID=UPI000BF44194|nr:coiled-coil-helix-coiled-coil-helix domain-containing protein 2-like isoform X2 [Varroa jacobsoni]
MMLMRRQAPAPPAKAAPPALAPAQTQVAHAPPAAPQASQQPGLFAQMATTAAGVAVGSAVGHTVGHAVTSAFSGGSSDAPAASQPVSQQPAVDDPCYLEMKQFMECAKNQHDITLCQGFNDVLRACKQRHEMPI